MTTWIGTAVLAALGMLATVGAAEAKCNDGKDRHVKVVNDTSYTIRRLYGSNVGADTWQEDVLGDGVIAPGHMVRVNFDDGTCYCSFDFKAVFSDNTQTIHRAYNVCTESVWRIHE